MLLLLISFIAGVLTVLAPCILPLLPVVVGGSLTDGRVNKRKAFTIVVALGVSVILFTFLLKVSTLFIDIPEYTWKVISGSIVLLLGIITIVPSLWETDLMAGLSSRSNIILGKGDSKKSFWGDVIVGAALGPVFSTCSPTYFIVLATVLPVNLSLGIVYLLSYVIGLSISLLFITFIGQKVVNKLNIAADSNGLFKKVLGLIFILVGMAILTGFDKKIEAKILSAGFFDITRIEQKLLEKNTNKKSSEKATTTQEENSVAYLSPKQKEERFDKVPEISSPDGFVNTEGLPVTLSELRGKVVLLDIWTYSCINCQRTIPYLNEWHKKYKDQGLVIVGLHTPEFAFEKVVSNVEKAVKGFNIMYPVVLDNDYSTWIALGNQYWPRKYLVDIDGYIVYDHIGEGSYEETEVAIQKALRERSTRLGINETMPEDIAQPSNVITVDSQKVKSPEIYFGSSRNEYLSNGRVGVSGEQTFSLPKTIFSNSLYLNGIWNITSEYSRNVSAGDIVFRYQAKNVYMTAGSKTGVDVEVYLDDVFVKKIFIKDEKLYSLVEGIDYSIHTLNIKVLKAGLEAFTFTFG